MRMMKVFKGKWLEITRSMNERGIPIPMIRDSHTGKGSMSLTLVFISFNVWLMSVVGKIAGHLGGMDPNQCLNMFLACAGLYWGRKFQKDGDKSELDVKKEDQGS